MHHPTSMVHWADIESTEVKEASISELFQRYSPLAIQLSENIFEVDFSNMNVKLKDWFGWSKLLKVKKTDIRDMKIWGEYKIANKSILLLPETLIPCYFNLSDYVVGFHGEIRYQYEVKPMNDLRKGDMIRVRNGFNADKEIEFADRVILTGTKEGRTFFELSTQSKGVNINEVYMYAG